MCKHTDILITCLSLYTLQIKHKSHHETVIAMLELQCAHVFLFQVQ